MFGHMRAALGIDDKIDILTHIESLPTIEEQRVAHAKIEKVEEDAMNKMVQSSTVWPLILDRSRRSGTVNESMAISSACMLTFVLERAGIADSNMHPKQSQTSRIPYRKLLTGSYF